MKKKAYLPFSAGVVVGVLIAFALFGGKREPQTQVARISVTPLEKTVLTNANMTMIQAGTPVGFLKQGTKLWSRSDAAPSERAQLLLEWNGSETFDALFRPVADDSTPAIRKASASLEPPR